MEDPSPRMIEYAELLLGEHKAQEARLLLTAFLKRNPESVPAWWAMCRAVDTDKEEMDCLERILRLEPGHEGARLRLEQMKTLSQQETPPEPMLIPKAGEAPKTELPPEPMLIPKAGEVHKPAASEPPKSDQAVSPFTFTDEAMKSEAQELNLFAPGSFKDLSAPPASAEPAAPPPAHPPRPHVTTTAEMEAEWKKVEAEKVKDEAPAWAVPPEPEKKEQKRKPRRKLSWVVILFLILGCIAIAAGAIWGFQQWGDAIVNQIQATQQVASLLTARPPATLEPTWTASATNTLIPTETDTPTLTPGTPTDTHTPLFTPQDTPIPASAIGLTNGKFPPDFLLVDEATGEQVQLYDYFGQPILIFFWETWCPYCNDELPSLQDLYEKYQDEGLVVLAVQGDASLGEITAFRAEHGLTFPILMDNDKVVQTRYQVTGVPNHVFVNRSGKIVYVSAGEMDYADLEAKIRSINKVFPTSTP